MSSRDLGKYFPLQILSLLSPSTRSFHSFALALPSSSTVLRNVALSAERIIVKRGSRPTNSYPKALNTSSRSTNLQLRNFCLSSFQCFTESSPPTPYLTPRRNLSYTPPTRAYPIRRPPTQRLTAAEQDWLQEDHITLDSPHRETLEFTPRFDWRLRAQSRTKAQSPNPVKPGDPENPEKRKYVKRVRPPQVNVQEHEKHYQAIQAYQTRYECYLDFSSTSVLTY